MDTQTAAAPASPKHNLLSIKGSIEDKAALSKTAQALSVDVQEILDADPLYDARKQVENIPQTALCETAYELTRQNMLSQFMLGGVLLRIKAEEVWHQEGCTSFRQFAESKLGLKSASVGSYMNVYSHLTANGVSYETVKPLKWSVLREVACVLKPAKITEQVAKYSSMTADEAREDEEVLKAKNSTKQLAGSAGGDAKAKNNSKVKTQSEPKTAKPVQLYHPDHDEQITEYLRTIGPRKAVELLLAAYEPKGKALVTITAKVKKWSDEGNAAPAADGGATA